MEPPTNPADGLALPLTSSPPLSRSPSIVLEQSPTPSPPPSALVGSISQTRAVPLPYSSARTGLVYDVRMRHHVEIQPTNQDDSLTHPEDPRRIFEIYKELVEAGLVRTDGPGLAHVGLGIGMHAGAGAVQQQGLPQGQFLWRIPARAATKEEVCLVHAPAYYDGLTELGGKTEMELFVLGARMDSVYLHWETFACAELSAGGAIEACRAVWTGSVKNAIAVIRPPGHHAEHEESRGFCFFNNVAVAARALQQEFEDCNRVLVVDWDVHHGNGIQQAFYDDPSVLYVSIHLHSDGRFYPAGDYGDENHCGQGPGEGFNVNIPWSQKGMGDGDYMLAFQQILMPIAHQFDPDLVIVASGFDAADGDTLGGCHVSPAGYAHMTHMLKSLAGGKLAVCLEGGYNLRSIAKSALAVTRTLMGEPPDRLLSVTPTPTGVANVQTALAVQTRYWDLVPGLKAVGGPGRGPDSVDGARMHDVVRQWQAKVFWDEFRMSPLFVHRAYASPSWHDQVIATPNYDSNVPLLVLLHGPPDAVQYSDSTRNIKSQLHNLWVTDPPKAFVEQAIKLGYAVIDVNVPLHVTDADDDIAGNLSSDGDKVRRMSTRELILYLWQNYIFTSESNHVVLIGVGEAYWGVVDLLNLAEPAPEKVVSSIAITTHPLEPVRNAELTVYTPPGTSKRKFGQVVPTRATEVGKMVVEVRDEVFETLEQVAEEWREAFGPTAGIGGEKRGEIPMDTTEEAMDVDSL